VQAPASIAGGVVLDVNTREGAAVRVHSATVSATVVGDRAISNGNRARDPYSPTISDSGVVADRGTADRRSALQANSTSISVAAVVGQSRADERYSAITGDARAGVTADGRVG